MGEKKVYSGEVRKKSLLPTLTSVVAALLPHSLIGPKGVQPQFFIWGTWNFPFSPLAWIWFLWDHYLWPVASLSLSQAPTIFPQFPLPSSLSQLASPKGANICYPLWLLLSAWTSALVSYVMWTRSLISRDGSTNSWTITLMFPVLLIRFKCCPDDCWGHSTAGSRGGSWVRAP